ncbi:MAG: septum formation initiator family protein [Albidovulum sp.]|nr:septum formation initiator family protein [Albidovulum sp.]
MKFRINIRIYGAIACFTGMALLGFHFAYEAVQGEYGIISRVAALDREIELTNTLLEIESELEILANKTNRLSDGNLDLDLLDERARIVLGMIRDDEFVVK